MKAGTFNHKKTAVAIRVLWCGLALYALYGFLGPRLDFHAPVTLSLVLWLLPAVFSCLPPVWQRQGAILSNPLITRLAFVPLLFLSFPGFWPLKIESPCAFAAFFLGVLVEEGLLHAAGMPVKNPLFFCLFPILLLAACLCPILDPDAGVFSAVLLVQGCFLYSGFSGMRQALRDRQRMAFLFSMLFFVFPLLAYCLSFLWILPDPVYLLLAGAMIVVLYMAFPLMNP
jgi:hypothetical protein